MMLNSENKHILPHENMESEIMNCQRETEQDILANKIVNAYYNLKKTNILIAQLSEFSAQKHHLQKQHKLLNAKLNSRIIEIIEKNGK
ncbi:MAG: hypothetical protein ABFS35_05295 [Bacteroidota bacterium]